MGPIIALVVSIVHLARPSNYMVRTWLIARKDMAQLSLLMLI